MTSTPLKVLLVAPEKTLLDSLSKFFDLLGLLAVQVTDPHLAATAAASERPDILILDSELLAHGGRELCRAVCGGGLQNHVFTLLLVPDGAPLEDMVEALKLGVDDFLAKPIVFGELLARLRAAARGLEYERRVQAYFGTESLPGLPNENAFRQALAAALAKPDRASSIACVAFDLDFFNRLNYMYGRPQADEALRGVARLLTKSCRPTDLAASRGDDCFCVLLPNRSEGEAGHWAEQFRSLLEETQFSLGTAVESITASFGVAAGVPGACQAEELLERASEALQAAKRSGRNCIMLRTSLDDDANAWTNLGAPGKLFDRTVARDVMTPSAITLKPDDSIVHAAVVFERTAQPAVPVVDLEGNLIGLLMADDLAGRAVEGQYATERVRDLMTTNPVRFGEQALFTELVGFFSEDPRALAVITDGSRPTGIITRNELVSLSEPLTAESFAAQDNDTSTSDYLIVPATSTNS
ncbi:MAG TPA: diguanylate cyclase [Pirellulales bacterium]|jgi:diguanylate cyclase (GGDEF)-like protein